MRQRTHQRIIAVIVLLGIVGFGCTAPARYREIPIGSSSEEVLRILGEPYLKQEAKKQTPSVEYFGPKPSEAYRELPEGTIVEIWSYRYFRETWTYTFSREGHTSRLVDRGYYHPDIVY